MYENFGIDKGHMLQGEDTGAEGCGLKEQDLTREVGGKVIEYLQGQGYSVVDCTPEGAEDLNASLYLRYTVANRNEVEEFVSIHFNNDDDGNGYGTEVWTQNSDESKRIAENVLNSICDKFGYSNRGVKVQGVDGQHIAVLNNANMPAILVECCFIDSESDIALLDTDKMAQAIVEGLTGYKINNGTIVTVQSTLPVYNLSPNTKFGMGEKISTYNAGQSFTATGEMPGYYIVKYDTLTAAIPKQN